MDSIATWTWPHLTTKRWNVGPDPRYTATPSPAGLSDADDLAFLDALIERVRGQYERPVSRVFMSGGSNGALMTLSYAITGSANLAAAATSSGNLPLHPSLGACSAGPSRPVPILMTHGTADTQMPYQGGCVANVGAGAVPVELPGGSASR